MGQQAWTQTPKEIIFVLPWPSGAKAKDMKYKCTSKVLEMSVLGETLLSGTFYYPVRADDSVWELEDAPGF